MPSWGHGKYGESGGRKIGEAFDRFAADSYFRSSPDSERGFEARLRYLLQHGGGAEAMHAQGLRPTTGRVVDWLTGDVRPTRQTRARMDAAYRQVRRRNVARALKQKLSTGRRVTVEPLPASRVPADQRRRQAQFSDREVTIRPSGWNGLVDAWEDDDLEGLDDEWMDIAGDMGSPPEAYYEVGHVGFTI